MTSFFLIMMTEKKSLPQLRNSVRHPALSLFLLLPLPILRPKLRKRPELYGVDGVMTTANVQLPLPADEIQTSVRRPRKQVSRACDWCRARKIRCDNAQPCKACRQRNAQCTHKGIDDEPRTLPQALRYEVYTRTHDIV